MTLTWALTTLLAVIVGVVIGYSVALRQWRSAPSSQANELALQQSLLTDQQLLETCAQSLIHLTSKVDTQVGEHTERVGEITQSLQADSNSELTLSAGQLLISTNLQLKSELDDARVQIRLQREQMASCMRESRTDALTNIPNRRAFDSELSRSVNEYRQQGTPFTLLMLDIDHFKRVNDIYGHMVGDQVLKCFANCLRNNLRDYDFIARYGGEEFAVILPETDLPGSMIVAERIRHGIESRTHRVGQHDISMTTSIGAKQIHNLDSDADLIQQADTALYAAKKLGRNSVYYWDNATSTPEASTQKLISFEATEIAVAEVSLSRQPQGDRRTALARGARE